MGLTACTPATVCDRRKTSAGKYQIRYQSEVDDGTERPRTSDWITLDKAEYEACQMGDKWPQCKRDAKDEDAPVNEPRRDAKRDDQDRNARRVCFDFVSEPKRELRYKWATPRRQKGPREGTWGIFSECTQADPGQVVNMSVEHITGPSTLLCTIYVMRNGKKVPIDMMITQAFGDCKVSAVVPPN
jgi:hypothetical protein